MIDIRQKPRAQQRPTRKIRKTCFDCVHGSAYDSEINKLPRGRTYCRIFGFVGYSGYAKICSLFEPHAPPSRRKKKRRW